VCFAETQLGYRFGALSAYVAGLNHYLVVPAGLHHHLLSHQIDRLAGYCYGVSRLCVGRLLALAVAALNHSWVASAALNHSWVASAALPDLLADRRYEVMHSLAGCLALAVAASSNRQ
jgi:hypothetical protein